MRKGGPWLAFLLVGARMRIENAVFTFRHTGFRLALTRVRANAPIQLCSRVRGGSGFFGGRSVSRILVADDNSNIQKMVALALKDEGIDVVAVGNGEAAMRKIPDLRPDLVLADIFMPVRNGYEVCEFVKSDSRYMNTPVVLLVGAFDPLDEQETQRVRADGVLKKPFIPPDPLINMVKALLAKNGQKPLPVRPVTPVKPATPAQTTPVPLNQPSSSSGINTAPAEESLRQRGKVSSSAQQQPPPFIAPARQPAPQTAKIQDSDEVVTSARDANLGDPSWATPAEPREL